MVPGACVAAIHGWMRGLAGRQHEAIALIACAAPHDRIAWEIMAGIAMNTLDQRHGVCSARHDPSRVVVNGSLDAACMDIGDARHDCKALAINRMK